MDEYASHVGERIKARRTSIGMTRADVARSVGVSPQQIHKYETGRNSANVARLIKIANALSVPVPYFFGGLPAFGNSAEVEAETEEVLSIARGLVRLPASTRAGIERVIAAAMEQSNG